MWILNLTKSIKILPITNFLSIFFGSFDRSFRFILINMTLRVLALLFLLNLGHPLIYLILDLCFCFNQILFAHLFVSNLSSLSKNFFFSCRHFVLVLRILNNLKMLNFHFLIFCQLLHCSAHLLLVIGHIPF